MDSFVRRILLLAALSPAAAAPLENWTPLFDGRTLSGWHRAGYVNGEAEFTVEDGCIVGTTRAGTPNSFLCSDREYADFILELEFNVPPGVNSGVQIRSLCDPNIQKGRVHGYQVEIDPSPRGWTAGIYDEARRGWLCNLTHIEKERGKEAAEAARSAFRQGDWNRLRVEAVGPRIRTWLNGVPVADLTDTMTPRGILALQVHATADQVPRQIRWRNLRLQELADAGTVPADVWQALRSWRYAEPREALARIEAAERQAQGEGWLHLEAQLIAVLEDTQATPDARRFVCGLLGRKGTPAAVPPLAACLADPDLGAHALQALARMPFPEVDGALKAALGLDLPPSQKAAVVAVCGQRRLESCLPELAANLSDPHPDVRRAAALALGRVGTPAAEERLREMPDGDGAQPLRAEALLLCAEQAGRLQDTERAERLCRKLLATDAPESVRAGALSVLADAVGNKALPELLRALETGPQLSRQAAARVLAALPGDTVVPEVTAALGRLPPEVQVMALTALAQRGDPAAGAAGAACLQSGHEPVRLAAIGVLEAAGRAEHVRALLPLAAGTGPEAAAAIRALARLQGAGVDEALAEAVAPDAPGAAGVVLAALGQRRSPRAVPLAMELLARTEDEDTRRAAWRALRDLAGPDHLEAVLAAFAKTPEGPVRREAERAASECLRRAEPVAASRALAAALGACPAPARPSLVTLFDACRTPESLAVLTGLLHDPDSQCRSEAVKALSGWPSPEPYEALRAYAAAADQETHHVLALRGCLRLLDSVGSLPEAERRSRLDALAAIARRDVEKDLIRTVRDAPRVVNLEARSGKPVRVVPNGFVSGGTVYIDRPYTFTEVPALLAGATLLSTAMEDKASRGDAFITFVLTAPATVLVCYDGRARSVPEWLAGWRRLDAVLRSTDAGCPLNLFARDFPAGPVALAGNNPVPGVGAMYVAGILPAAPP